MIKKDYNKISICSFFTKKFQGFGIIISFENPYAAKEPFFILKLHIFYYTFWLIKYK